MSTTIHTWFGYSIQAKEDWGASQGFWIDGKLVRTGWVVTKGNVNVMPGAVWFQTVAAARQGIAALELSGGEPGKFWLYMELCSGKALDNVPVALEPAATKADPTDNQVRADLADAVIKCLQTAFDSDPAAMYALVINRVPCNEALADHPTIIVDRVPAAGKTRWAIGTLGLLNGVLKLMGVPLVATKWSDHRDVDGQQQLLGFTKYTGGA